MSATALYTDLSHYYDLMCADIDYQAQSHCVRRLHQLFGNQGRRHLDLACGTGPHVRHFLDFGYRSAGLTSTSRCSTSPDSAVPKRTSAGRTWPASRWTSRWT